MSRFLSISKNGFASLAVSAVAGIAYAQQPLLEEVIVTATKRQESLQDVPVSVTAFSDEAIQNLGILDSASIAPHTPNMMWRSDFGETSPNIFLRGVGNNSFHASAVSAVGIYTDGVYLNSNLSHGFQLFDQERIEVLRGPQGTLYGRNTSGGLVHFISAKPQIGEGYSAVLDATVGNYSKLELGGALNVPLGNKAALRLSGTSRQRDGVFDAQIPGLDDKGEAGMNAWRALVSVQATDDIDILFNVHGGEVDTDLRPMKSQGQLCPPGVDLQAGFGFGCTDFLGFADTADYHDSFESLASVHTAESLGASITLNWSFASAELTGITAYESADRQLLEDTDRSPAEFLNGSWDAEATQFSQELRLTSLGSEGMRWIVGAFYFQEELKQYEAFSFNDFGPGGLTGGLLPFEEGLAFDHEQDTESYAVFGELGFDLTDKLSLTVGGRVTYDERDVNRYTALLYDATGFRGAYVPREYVEANGFLVNSVPLKEDWTDWSGRVVLDYAVAEDVMLYASASRGFKGGEFNPGAAFFAEEYGIADPEYIFAWEAGIKSTLLNGALRLNAAAFYYDFEDQQVFTLASGGGLGIPVQTLTNAGESEIRGMEVEVQYQPSIAWYFQLGVGVLDSEFKEYEVVDPSSGAITDFSGNEQPSAPKLNLNAVARYEWDLAEKGALSLQIDSTFTDDQFFTADNVQALTEDGYWLLNARLRWLSEGGRYDATLWAKNLLDEEYILTAFDTADFGLNSVGVGDPLTVGATLRVKW